jgi:hypothetical protein
MIRRSETEAVVARKSTPALSMPVCPGVGPVLTLSKEFGSSSHS